MLNCMLFIKEKLHHSDRDISSCVYMDTCITDNQKQALEMLYGKSVLKIFVTFAGKHQCQSLFFKSIFLRVFICLEALIREACNVIKKETLAQVFSSEFCEIFKNFFFTEHLGAALSALNNLRSDKVMCNIP